MNGFCVGNQAVCASFGSTPRRQAELGGRGVAWLVRGSQATATPTVPALCAPRPTVTAVNARGFRDGSIARPSVPGIARGAAEHGCLEGEGASRRGITLHLLPARPVLTTQCRPGNLVIAWQPQITSVV